MPYEKNSTDKKIQPEDGAPRTAAASSDAGGNALRAKLGSPPPRRHPSRSRAVSETIRHAVTPRRSIGDMPRHRVFTVNVLKNGQLQFHPSVSPAKRREIREIVTIWLHSGCKVRLHPGSEVRHG